MKLVLPCICLLAGFAIGALTSRLRSDAQAEEPRPEIAQPAPDPLRAPQTPQQALARVPALSAQGTGANAQLLATLEQVVGRLDAIEQRLASAERRPLQTGGPSPAELRSMVESVVAQTEELDRRRAEERASAERAEKQELATAKLRFHMSGMVARLSEEVGLQGAQREALLSILVDFTQRQKHLHQSVDPLTTDVLAWQAELDGLEDWLWREVEDALGAATAQRLREHF